MHLRSRKAGVTLLATLAAVKICLFGLALGLGWQPFVGSNAEDHYLPAAKRLLTEHRFNGPDSRPDSKVPPGYPILLATVARVTGDPVDGIVVLQILADFVTAVCMCGMGADLGWAGAGLLAGILWECFPPALAISTWVTAETIFTTVFIGAILCFMRAKRSGSPCVYAMSGLLLAMATLIRATTIVTPLLLVFFFQKGPRRVRCVSAFLLASLIPVGMWVTRNIIVLQDPITVSVGFGSTFLQGSDESVFTGPGKTALYSDMFARAASAGVRRPPDDKESKIDHWMFAIGMHNYELRWRERPWSFPFFVVHKVFRLFYGTESGSGKTEAVLLLCSVIVIPLALISLSDLYSRAPQQCAMICAVIAYFLALHIVTLPEFRYIFPCFPLFMLMACATLVSWIRALSKQAIPETTQQVGSHAPDVPARLRRHCVKSVELL